MASQSCLTVRMRSAALLASMVGLLYKFKNCGAVGHMLGSKQQEPLWRREEENV
ncbi:hypothetical protein SAY87_011309 [Trapa incisa]|uniref:Uncharacterized protein n=1 Tax=Trapa incisa TaxID=236973 RepID=A0AAN7JIQ1_9MYRT|nr:hypothetical protein SAY87_011309 [Trapa incisa]